MKKPVAFARRAKAAGAHVLEIRGDLTPGVSAFRSSLPLLISPRGAGRSFLSRCDAAIVDLELGETAFLPHIPAKTKIILSHHDYERTPTVDVCMKIVQKMYSLNPWMIKIALTLNEYSDILVIKKIQEILNKKSIRSSVLGMGPKAHLLRLLSPVENTLTYAFLDGTEHAAAGQVSLSMYQLMKGRKHPVLFGIIGGSQISSSLSPVIHNWLFQKHKVDAVYAAFPTDDFRKTLKTLEKLCIKGLSVTSPCKRDAFQSAASADPLSDELRSSNLLTRTSKGWKAWNTDAVGIEKGYPFLHNAATVAIIGAGGVVPSVIAAVRGMNPSASITVFARDARKAATEIGRADIEYATFSTLKASRPDTVICAVSEDVSLPLPRARNGAVCIDLRDGYVTQCMKQAKRAGYRVYDGLPMLLYQGLRQYEIFTGSKASAGDARALAKLLRSSR